MAECSRFSIFNRNKLKSDNRYQCPRCANAEVEEIDGDKGRFCSNFSHVFRPDVEKDQEELKRAKFTYKRPDGWDYTRECRIVSRGWLGNCAGFRS